MVRPRFRHPPSSGRERRQCCLTTQPGTSKYLRCQHVTIASKPLWSGCAGLWQSTHTDQRHVLCPIWAVRRDGTRGNQLNPWALNSDHSVPDPSTELKGRHRRPLVVAVLRIGLTISGMVRAYPVWRHFSERVTGSAWIDVGLFIRCQRSGAGRAVGDGSQRAGGGSCRCIGRRMTHRLPLQLCGEDAGARHRCWRLWGMGREMISSVRSSQPPLFNAGGCWRQAAGGIIWRENREVRLSQGTRTTPG